MIRDWAGLDSSSSDVVVELDSAGPGEGDRSLSGSAGGVGVLLVADVMGKDDSRCLAICVFTVGRLPGLGDDEPPPSRNTAVLVEALRDTGGRVDV